MIAGPTAPKRSRLANPMVTGPAPLHAGSFFCASLASDKPPRLQRHHVVLGFCQTSLLLAMACREAGAACR